MYYDGTKLLSLKDINGNKPEIYFCTSNRTGGKTTYFNRLLVKRYLNDQSRKFGLIVRYGYELSDCSSTFFSGIKSLFYNDYEMHDIAKERGGYSELYIGKGEWNPKKKSTFDDYKLCGFVIPLNSAELIKKRSHLLSCVDSLTMDEFQSETGKYVQDEVKKLISIHTSLARGNGEQKRYLPIYMIGNQVSLLNPYYVELGICDKLRDDTNFLRGDGYVVENGFVESAATAQLESGVMRAFKGNQYANYSTQKCYLNDNKSFIAQPVGHSKYIATLLYNGDEFCIREYATEGILFCGRSVDKSFPLRISVTTEDHNINYIMLRKHEFFCVTFRQFFDSGCFRFQDLKSRECIFRLLTLH